MLPFKKWIPKLKRVDKQDEPEFIKSFNEKNVYDGVKHKEYWDKFKSEPDYQAEVVDRLLDDQGFLCAYCEIDIYRRDGVGGIQDIGVEHFHPKSSFKDNIAWVTKWSNLLAVCLGGSNNAVHDPDVRYGAPDLTCDKKKADAILDSVILHPLHMPEAPLLFKVSRTSGELGVDTEACVIAGIDAELAQCTISQLNLNADRLKKARRDTLNDVANALIEQVKKGRSPTEARQIIAKARLTRSNGRYLRFFTACRSYLGKEAEVVLGSIDPH
jgi:uncharacterized protein (TIGR02646 family)